MMERVHFAAACTFVEEKLLGLQRPKGPKDLHCYRRAHTSHNEAGSREINWRSRRNEKKASLYPEKQGILSHGENLQESEFKTRGDLTPQPEILSHLQQLLRPLFLG